MIYDSAAVDEVLLVLKIAFLVLLYLFIWRIVRSATRDLRLPQESFVLGPEAAAALRGEAPRTATARLVVEKSPALREGSDLVLNSAPLTMGRGEANDVELRGDDFASAEHARFEPRRDGVWLTDDHSLVGELVRSGKLAPEEAETHPQRSVITRVLGTDPDVDVDTTTIETRSGDLFLLCSDGLYSMVGNDRILELVERNRRDLDAAAKALVAAANKGGGDDNITVVAFEIVPDGEAAPTAQEPAPDEEETLDEADHVPTVKVAREEEPEPAAGPKPPLKVLAFLAILILAIAASIVIYLLVR